MQNVNDMMAGKTCMVTGATSGIGQVTALELARRGASIIVVGRSRERCTATVDSIRRETGNSSVEWLQADLGSLNEVRRLAQVFVERYK